MVQLNHIITPWDFSDNIAFYRSSGRSRTDGATRSVIANTWFPCLGILETKQFEQERGYIVKMSSLFRFEEDFIMEWMLNLIYAYMFEKYGNNEDTEMIDTLTPKIISMIKDIPKLMRIKDIMMDLNFVYTLLTDYFAFDWQVYISASFGGGVWDDNHVFRRVVLDYLQHYREIILPNISFLPLYSNFEIDEKPLFIEYYTGNESDNTSEAILFFKQNHCQPDMGVVEEISDNIKRNIPKKIYKIKFNMVNTIDITIRTINKLKKLK